MDIDKANAELARLCGYEERNGFWFAPETLATCGAAGHWGVPDFLAGLLPDGSCDEAKVNWDVLGRAVKAMREAPGAYRIKLVWLSEAAGYPGWHAEYVHRRSSVGHPAENTTHAHPVAALYLAAKDAGLPEKGESRD